MSPMKKPGSFAFAAGRAASDTAMCERAAFANTIPSPISPASATIFLRSVASTIGGSSPTRGAARSPATNARVSASGGPAFTPMRSSAGPWETPMPNAKRPPDSSCTSAAVCA